MTSLPFLTGEGDKLTEWKKSSSKARPRKGKYNFFSLARGIGGEE